MELNKILNILLQFGKEILYEKNFDTLLVSIANLTRDLVDAERCSIFIYDSKKDVLYTKIAHGVDYIEIPSDKGIVGFTAKTGEVQIIVDAYNDKRFYPEVDKVTGFTTKNLLTVPLLDSNNNVFGVLEAVNKRSGFFSNLDAELLLLSASYISYILENAILNKKIKENSEKLIYKLSSAAEFKDEETSLHTKRVAFYSEIIASKLDIDEVLKEYIKITAPMHDAGKIGIPDKILQKPGKLTEKEFEIIKTHPTIGYNILKDEESEVLQIAANISLDHHERWDGTGYPNGKKGKEITLEGRIVAIADVFDALTTKRPYKKPWPLEKAINLIKSEQGKHFDPELIKVFINEKEAVEYVYKQYKED
jgi:HD-GYP domain-containing protein (c-di-GMP phosphodiesterase class II)